jgi:YVTN family beta-propeller protein
VVVVGAIAALVTATVVAIGVGRGRAGERPAAAVDRGAAPAADRTRARAADRGAAPAADRGAAPAADRGAARYVAVAPARLLDTRAGGAPADGTTTRLVVAGHAGVPATATAVALNVTVTETTAPGFVTVWPAGVPRPEASNLNVEHAGQTIPNLVIVPVGEGGAVDLFTQAATHVVVDVIGAWEPVAGTAPAGRFQPTGPTRVLDTRSGAAPASGTTLLVDLGAEAAGASGAVLNVTATEASAAGFITVWGPGAPRPVASNVNVERAGQTVANLVVTPVDGSGHVAVFVQSATHLVIDLVGTFTGDAAPPSDDGLFVPLPPARVLDSRAGDPVPRLRGGARTDLAVAGRAGIPTTGVAAVVMNLTATEASNAGFVTAYPARTALPPTSNLNTERTWQTIANLAIVRMGGEGAVSFYAQRTTELVADVSGWFLGAPAPIDPSVPATPPPPAIPSSDGTLVAAGSIGGTISPKSVVATGTGLVFAQNMIYSHTITVYGRDHRLLATIPDRTGALQGGPVEAAVTPDGRYVYVSNYSMYGPGAGREGFDACMPGDGIADSTVYRVSVGSLAVDQVIRVGPVPKFLAVTPDGRRLVVSNWCGESVSIVDTGTGQEVQRIPVGHNPRGVAITADSRTAYIALMGANRLAVIDLPTGTVRTIGGVGGEPRHLNLSPDGHWLYITLNADGAVAKMDTTTERVVARVATGNQPRSAWLAADGANLFVVNYESASVSKVRTADMTVVQTVGTSTHPIGITYDDETRELWVACYVGRIFLFTD